MSGGGDVWGKNKKQQEIKGKEMSLVTQLRKWFWIFLRVRWFLHVFGSDQVQIYQFLCFCSRLGVTDPALFPLIWFIVSCIPLIQTHSINPRHARKRERGKEHSINPRHASKITEKWPWSTPLTLDLHKHCLSVLFSTLPLLCRLKL